MLMIIAARLDAKRHPAPWRGNMGCRLIIALERWNPRFGGETKKMFGSMLFLLVFACCNMAVNGRQLCSEVIRCNK